MFKIFISGSHSKEYRENYDGIFKRMSMVISEELWKEFEKEKDSRKRFSTLIENGDNSKIEIRRIPNV